MKIVLFGATGMVGQGVLRECLLDADVTEVVAVVRSATGQTHEKLKELQHADFYDFSAVEDRLAGYDACLFCLGVSAAGLNEADYTHVTYDLTLAAAQALVRRNPGMTFVYVSGGGTDSSEKGRSMWARVKGRTENALLEMPFKANYMFRPAYIQPMHGITSRTRWYRIIYVLFGPLYPLLKKLFPRYVTTSEEVARAMLRVVKHGADRRVLENFDINRIAQEA
jgi:uncharacterized protein YbjT (DUF2867 family)